MYKYIDNKYSDAIIALKIFHSKRNFRVFGLIVYFIFLCVSIVIFWGKGNIIFLSPFISLLVTILFIIYANNDIKKKSRSNIFINAIEITFNDKNINITTRLKNDIKTNTIPYSNFYKCIENKDYYFLYNDKNSAIALNKQKIKEEGFNEFIKQRVKFK